MVPSLEQLFFQENFGDEPWGCGVNHIAHFTAPWTWQVSEFLEHGPI